MQKVSMWWKKLAWWQSEHGAKVSMVQIVNIMVKSEHDANSEHDVKSEHDAQSEHYQKMSMMEKGAAWWESEHDEKVNMLKKWLRRKSEHG